MKKIKYVILIISVIFLSGCDLLLNLLEDNNGVTFEIENDISIRKTDYNDFDFSTVIKIYKDGKSND